MKAATTPSTHSLLLIAALGLSAAACGTELARAEQAEAVRAVPLVGVEARSVPQTIKVTGSLIANQQSRVAASTMGTVAATFVERGSYVAAGAPLARLDARSARLGAEEARAMAQAAKVQRELAEADCERAERLLSAQAINRADYDRMTAQCSANRWSSSAAEARAALAAKGLDDATVRAPFAGLVVERHVTVGEYVRPDLPIVTLVEIDPLRVELTVPESQVGAIALGQTVDLALTALPGEHFRGTIRYLGPSVREMSRDLVVEAVVENADRRLRPGMFALAQIQIGQAELPVIPRSALKEKDGSSRVFAVERGRLAERIVQLGPDVGDAVAVLGGLSTGDRVAAKADPDVRDGLRVE